MDLKERLATRNVLLIEDAAAEARPATGDVLFLIDGTTDLRGKELRLALHEPTRDVIMSLGEQLIARSSSVLGLAVLAHDRKAVIHPADLERFLILKGED